MTTLLRQMNERNLLRMIGWLPAGILFYAASMLIGTDHPQLQLLAWKLGHVCTFSWLGYWIARQALGRLAIKGGIDTNWEATLAASAMIARAIIIVGALWASNGL